MIFNLPYQKDKAISYIQRIDKPMLCKIGKDDRSRSAQQNRYYWFILKILQDETGNDKDDLHIYFRSKFLQATKEINGEFVEYTKSTTELSTLEFEDYAESIRVFSSRELGCFLPKPNETEFDYLKL